MEGIIASCITGILALIGVIVTNIRSESRISSKVENQLVTAQEVTSTKIQYLADEVKRHNNFASRMPVVEDQIKRLNKDVDEIKTKIGGRKDDD